MTIVADINNDSYEYMCQITVPEIFGMKVLLNLPEEKGK